MKYLALFIALTTLVSSGVGLLAWPFFVINSIRKGTMEEGGCLQLSFIGIAGVGTFIVSAGFILYVLLN